jgi:hypothetical protein
MLLPAVIVCSIGLLGFAARASAQAPLAVPVNHWDHGTTLNLLFGGANTSGDWRRTLGGAVGWEINHRVMIEGTGSWLIAGNGDDAFAAELKAIANLTRPQKIVPFVGAGVGMYLATFDTTRGTLPAFYQRRLENTGLGTTTTFADPSLVLSAGANIFTGRHVSVRPDVSVRLVMRAWETYAVPMATMYLTYHFEVHGE